MANLTVVHGVMGSGKTPEFNQLAYNFIKCGKEIVLIKPEVDKKGNDKFYSQFGGEFFRPADIILRRDETVIEAAMRSRINLLNKDYLIIDEAQFIAEIQAIQLGLISKKMNLPVICFCLLTDFQAKVFPSTAVLLGQADVIRETKTYCLHCGEIEASKTGRKIDGVFVDSGDQVVIDGMFKNVEYVPLCGQCYYTLVTEQSHESKAMFNQIIEMKQLGLQDVGKPYTKIPIPKE